jgi:hypothetical protein
MRCWKPSAGADRERRRILWARLQAIYAEELPSLPLWFRQDAHIWPAWLEGVRPNGAPVFSSRLGRRVARAVILRRLLQIAGDDGHSCRRPPSG